MTQCAACNGTDFEAADGELMCLGCGETQEAQSDTPERSGFKVAEVLEVDKLPGKDKLFKVTVNVGASDSLVLVTNAPNVATGAKIAIAMVGAPIGDADDGVVVQKANVGGVVSHGMVCDAAMLGWGSANKGRAAVLPASCEVGSVPPASKPKHQANS